MMMSRAVLMVISVVEDRHSMEVSEMEETTTANGRLTETATEQW